MASLSKSKNVCSANHCHRTVVSTVGDQGQSSTLCKYHKCVIPICEKRRKYSKFLCEEHILELTNDDEEEYEESEESEESDESDESKQKIWYVYSSMLLEGAWTDSWNGPFTYIEAKRYEKQLESTLGRKVKDLYVSTDGPINV